MYFRVLYKTNYNLLDAVEIKFHVGISSGIIPIGPKLEILECWGTMENIHGYSLEQKAN